MSDELRNTAKFRPVQHIITHTFTTSSTIKVPKYLSNLKPKTIHWLRKYQDTIQKLQHLTGHFEYVCTQLDKDCTIQAIIQSQLNNHSIDIQVNVYGPIIFTNQLLFLLQNINQDNQVFDIQVISHHKNYQCYLIFSGTQIILKNKNIHNNNTYPNSNQFIISYNDIILTYLSKQHSTQILIFPTIYLRIAGLKLFNQIISKGTYSDNNDSLLIKIYDPQDTNPKIRTYYKWKRLLLKINNVKYDKIRRMSLQANNSYKNGSNLNNSIINSMNNSVRNINNSINTSNNIINLTHNNININLNNNNKNNNNSNNNSNSKSIIPVIIDIQNKKNPDARYSQDISTTPLQLLKYKQQNMKKSETYQRNTLNNKNNPTNPANVSNKIKNSTYRQSQSDAIQSDNPYLMQFQNLIYQQNDQPQKDAIALNNSFEQFQKKSKSQKQIQKLAYVKAKKKQRDTQNNRTKKLKQKLQAILIEQEQLLTINQKLKNDIQRVQLQKNQNYTAQIAANKILLMDLKAEYQWLLEQSYRRNEEQRRSVHRNDKDKNSKSQF